jgi:hypothetical protein
MPEALAVVLVFVVSVAAYVGAMLQAKKPVVVRDEIARATIQQEWLSQRLSQARREGWDAQMVSEIERQLNETNGELTQLSRR